MSQLTHLDEQGAARMVDIGSKAETERIAVATALVSMQPQTMALLEPGQTRRVMSCQWREWLVSRRPKNVLT